MVSFPILLYGRPPPLRTPAGAAGAALPGIAGLFPAATKRRISPDLPYPLTAVVNRQEIPLTRKKIIDDDNARNPDNAGAGNCPDADGPVHPKDQRPEAATPTAKSAKKAPTPIPKAIRLIQRLIRPLVLLRPRGDALVPVPAQRSSPGQKSPAAGKKYRATADFPGHFLNLAGKGSRRVFEYRYPLFFYVPGDLPVKGQASKPVHSFL